MTRDNSMSNINIRGGRRRRLAMKSRRQQFTFSLAVLFLLFLIIERVDAFWVPSLVLNHKSPRSTTASSIAGSSPLEIANINSQNDNSLVVDEESSTTTAPDLDAMRARAGVLRRSILQQQIELQQLERQIVCCSDPASSWANNKASDSMGGIIQTVWHRTWNTFLTSTNVARRKVQRVQSKVGVNNQQWKGSVSHYVYAQTWSGVRIVDQLWKNPTYWWYFLDPTTPSLFPHVPAILARLDRLESHVAPILERVLNNQRHLASIEPYLPQILDRFDDVEPHIPWILEHIDVLAPYTGLLLKHIDELLPYAQLDDHEQFGNGTQYDLAEQLLPYLEFYVSRLDTVGPHLPLLRPHVPKLLKHNRIAKMSPHIDRLFALGYKDNLGASANMDVLLFWFGWALRVPFLPRIFFAFPGSPRIVTFLANRLPKRFVRGYCSGVSCYVDGDYGGNWNKLSK